MHGTEIVEFTQHQRPKWPRPYRASIVQSIYEGSAEPSHSLGRSATEKGRLKVLTSLEYLDRGAVIDQADDNVR